tara:strand:- start:394 stop:537 length:144 start_codon:yes stop_codon:yes gene_type:complete
MSDEAQTDTHNALIPALRFKWLTRFYDNVLALTLPEQEIKSELTTRR